MSSLTNVMLVEDSLEDAELFSELLDMTDVQVDLDHCEDGLSAVTGLLEGRKRPDLIFLDLNLPGLDGREILRRIKGSQQTRKIPIIVMTTSENPKDIEYCYDTGANSYLTKPIEISSYMEAFTTIITYWLKVSKLPLESRPRRSPPDGSQAQTMA